MATALANNSLIPRRSNTVFEQTPNTKMVTSSLQKQNTPAPQSLDGKIEQVLAKARSPMGEDQVRRMVEVLDRALDPHYPITLHTRRRCLQELVKLCGGYDILPNSYMIPGSKIQKLGDAPISSGGFSDVWPGVYEDEKWIAVKVIRYYASGNIQQIKKDFCREVITWKRLSHPNILELYGVTMNDNEYAMVSPWMDNGNIVNHVRQDLEVNPLKLLEDAVRGLRYLHSVELAHGNLKGANILVSEEGCACLADFGTAGIADDLDLTTAMSDMSSSDCECTSRWCPPERLDPERFGFKTSSPTKKGDIYSMGMTIYEVLTDKVPFYGYEELMATYHIIEGVRPPIPNFTLTRGYTDKLWKMTSCWNEVASERPTVDCILEALTAAAEPWKPRHE